MARAQDMNLLRALEYEPQLRQCLKRSVGDEAAVNHLLQLTYARLLESGAVLPLQDAALKTFALRTAQNTAQRWLRECRPTSNTPRPEDQRATETPEYVSHPFDLERILSALQCVPARSRQMLTLYHIERLNPRQMAHRLQLSTEEVNRLLTFAICEYADALFYASACALGEIGDPDSVQRD